MNLTKEFAEALRLGGSDAVNLFIEGCFAARRKGGADAVSAWIGVALPLLPESDKAEVVAVLIEALMDDDDTESYTSSRLH